MAAMLFTAAVLPADVLPVAGQMYDVRQNSPLFWNNWSLNVTITGQDYHNNLQKSSAVQAGIFSLRWEPGPGIDTSTYNNFRAVCFDPFEIFWSSAVNANGEGDSEITHYVGTLGNYPNPPDSVPSQTNYPTLSNQKKDDLRRLYNLAFDQVDTKIKAAAFQVAVWEIVGETTSSYNVLTNNGTFYTNWTTSGGDGTQAAAQANTWLSSLASATPVELLAWSPVYKYAPNDWRRAVGQELLTPTPEPHFYGVLAAGMVGLFVAARRRRMQQN
jgi:hypothetical protein